MSVSGGILISKVTFICEVILIISAPSFPSGGVFSDFTFTAIVTYKYVAITVFVYHGSFLLLAISLKIPPTFLPDHSKLPTTGS
jgi:hypothetical protein